MSLCDMTSIDAWLGVGPNINLQVCLLPADAEKWENSSDDSFLRTLMYSDTESSSSDSELESAKSTNRRETGDEGKKRNDELNDNTATVGGANNEGEGQIVNNIANAGAATNEGESSTAGGASNIGDEKERPKVHGYSRAPMPFIAYLNCHNVPK